MRRRAGGNSSPGFRLKGFFSLTAALSIASSLVTDLRRPCLHFGIRPVSQPASSVAFIRRLILLFLYRIAIRSRGPTT